MGNRAEPAKADLRGRTFDGMNGAEKAIDFFRIVVAFERKQAIADDLEMLFGFGLEKFQDFVRDFIVRGQGVEIGTSEAGLRRSGILRCGREVGDRLRSDGIGHAEIERRRLWRERETIAFLESGNIFAIFLAGIANLNEAGFEERDAVGQEFGDRTVEIVAERGVQRILKDVGEFAGDFREAREAVTGGRAFESVCGDIQTLEIFATRSDFLKYADVFPQILQVLRGFLEEQFDGFTIRHAHARPSVTSSGFCNSSASRLAIHDAIAQNNGLELHRHFGDGFGMAEEEIAARFQGVVETLDQGTAALFGKIDEDVHAENQIHTADVDGRSEIHLRETDNFAEAWLHLMAVAGMARRKMRGELAFTDAGDAAAGIDAAFGGFQCLTADIGSEDFHFPRIGERKRVKNGDSDGVRLFSSGAASAPDAQGAGIAPELFDVQFR